MILYGVSYSAYYESIIALILRIVVLFNTLDCMYQKDKHIFFGCMTINKRFRMGHYQSEIENILWTL